MSALCREARPVVCAHCGRLRMKALRVGVSRLREELAALLGVAVGEVAGPRAAVPRLGGGAGTDPDNDADPSGSPAEPVLIGTEAVLHQRVRRAAARGVPRHRPAPVGGAALGHRGDTFRAPGAGRPAGRCPRGRGPARRGCWSKHACRTIRSWLPSPQGAGPVLDAAAEIRRASGLPPFSALALVSGSLAPAYADALVRATTDLPGVSVAPLDEARFLVQAAEHGPLCDLLAGVPRPPGRGLRVEVDPTAL